MAIVLITGPSRSGKSYIANALRCNAISNQKGALLLDENNDGDPKALLEKLIVEFEFDPELGIKQPWKPDPQIIVVGLAGAKKFDQIEALCPGLKSKFGPIYKVVTG